MSTSCSFGNWQHAHKSKFNSALDQKYLLDEGSLMTPVSTKTIRILDPFI